MTHLSNRTYYAIFEDGERIGTITEGKMFRPRLKELLKAEWGNGVIDIDRIYTPEYRKVNSFEIKGQINNHEFIIELKKEYVF